jgi:1-phosphofructokinase family hexose kinase
MIVCLGTTPVYQRSMVFDRVKRDGVNRATAVYDYASGKSINVARVLHTLGEDVVALGFAGGERGAAMLAELTASGIRHDFVREMAPTRQCITVIDQGEGTATELVEEARPIHNGHAERLLTLLAERLRSASACVLSGSLPPNFDPTFYLRCLRLLPGRPIPVILDARGEPLRHALPHGGFIAKMNRDELGATVNRPPHGDAEILAAARTIVPAGGAIVVTLGAEGAIVANDKGGWRIHAPSVTAVSAVGSGDAFAAGMVKELVRGQSLPDACALGAACGAANAMTDRAGYVNARDVEDARRRVTVEPIP